MVAEMATILLGRYFRLERMPAPEPKALTYSNTRELGKLLYTDYVYPFEIAAVPVCVLVTSTVPCHVAAVWL